MLSALKRQGIAQLLAKFTDATQPPVVFGELHWREAAERLRF
jgi:hypothetical protein